MKSLKLLSALFVVFALAFASLAEAKSSSSSSRSFRSTSSSSSSTFSKSARSSERYSSPVTSSKPATTTVVSTNRPTPTVQSKPSNVIPITSAKPQQVATSSAAVKPIGDSAGWSTTSKPSNVVPITSARKNTNDDVRYRNPNDTRSGWADNQDRQYYRNNNSGMSVTDAVILSSVLNSNNRPQTVIVQQPNVAVQQPVQPQPLIPPKPKFKLIGDQCSNWDCK